MSSSLATPWTVASQAPLSMGFSRQEYWSGLPFLLPGDLHNPGIEPTFPALVGVFFCTFCGALRYTQVFIKLSLQMYVSEGVYFHHKDFGEGSIKAQLMLRQMTNQSAERISLVVQWLRICLPMQGTWVPPPSWEDSTYWGATKLVCHNYWRPHALGPMFCNKRSPRSKKPEQHS